LASVTHLNHFAAVAPRSSGDGGFEAMDMVNTLLPSLALRLARMPLATMTWLERAHHVLTGRTLIILVGHYYVRDGEGWIDNASVDVSLEYLSRECDVMPLQDALRRLEAGKPLPRKAVSLVVDDAAAPFYDMGWPSLHAAGIPFSLGVVPGLIREDTAEHLVARIMYGITSIESDQRRGAMLQRARASLGHAASNDGPPLERLFDALRGLGTEDLAHLAVHLDTPDETYMTWEQLAELRAHSVDLVPHSMSHPRFRYVTGSWLDWELSRSAELLEEHTHDVSSTFVFPYGSTRCVTPRVRSGLVRHGYRYGLVTKPGITTPESDRFVLPRVNAEVSPDEFVRNVDRWQWAFAGRRRTLATRDPLSQAPAAATD